MHELDLGCDELHQPHELTLELVSFLLAKRRAAAEHPSWSLSPSQRLDDLWRWMLLNTRVATLVHDLIGGVVEHSTCAAWDGDDAKLLSRLRAMTLMLANGHAPQLHLWEEPGTVFSGIQLLDVAVAVAGRGVVCHSVRLFICNAATTTVAVEVLLREAGYELTGFTRSSSGLWRARCRLRGVPAKKPAVSGAKKPSAPKPASVKKAKPAPKPKKAAIGDNYYDDEDDAPQAGHPGDMVTISVRTLTGQTLPLCVPLRWTVRALKGAVQDREGIPPDR